MPQISTELLEELKTDLRRLQRAGWTWHKIGLVLFNRDGTYAAHIYHDDWIPSQDALEFYFRWRALDAGKREDASPELCDAVWDHLLPSKENSQTSTEIGDYFLIHPRKIRKACAVLRDQGFLVGSCGNGYYKIVKPSEKVETIRKLWAHEKGIRKARLNVARTPLVDRLPRQS